jgi:hypothetical protein
MIKSESASSDGRGLILDIPIIPIATILLQHIASSLFQRPSLCEVTGKAILSLFVHLYHWSQQLFH